ncbi:CPBP family intramembrane glutamic endopeptidase [Nocardia sp. NPDC051030]|uniref:CPBP family intramembrane glutamic endopeptidase n=1 Tax=Nocardia sp. NPDC051030 TaxID=3155162 RepID=UPI0034294B29
MRPTTTRLKALAALSLPLLWTNTLLPAFHLNIRGRSAANAAFATAYAVTFRGRPNWFSPRGLAYGSAAAAVVLSGYAAALAIPSTRRHFAELADRGPDVHAAEWAGVHIPVGTVFSEELVYRATLDPVLEEAFGRPGEWLAALTFGLTHIQPARSVGDPVPATIAVTTLGGLLFTRLRRHTGSATAPALLHLAMNAGGAIAPILARLILSGQVSPDPT